MGEPLGKQPLARYKREWERKIKIDLRETGCENRKILTQDNVQRRALVLVVFTFLGLLSQC